MKFNDNTLYLVGHNKSVTSLIEIPGNNLISGSLDKNIKFWDIKSYLCTYTIDIGKGEIRSMIKLND